MIALALRFWYVGVIALLVAAFGAQQLRVSSAKSELATYKLEVEENARIAEQMARQEDQRRQQVYDEQAEAARKEQADLQADVSRLATQSDGLRDELAAFQRRAKQNSSASIGGKSQPSQTPTDLLAGLYLGSVRTNQDIARYAEELWSRGSTCERSADALRK